MRSDPLDTTLRALAHQAREAQAARDLAAAAPFWQRLEATLPRALEQASREGRTAYTVDLRRATRSGLFKQHVAAEGVRRALRKRVGQWAVARGLRADDPNSGMWLMGGTQPDEVLLRWDAP